MKLHVTINRASPNRQLATFSTDLFSSMMERRRKAMSLPGATAATYAEHVAIVEAPGAHDPEARQGLAAHTGRIHATTQVVMQGGSRKDSRQSSHAAPGAH